MGSQFSLLTLAAIACQCVGQTRLAPAAGKMRIKVLVTVDVYISDRSDSSQIWPGAPLASAIFAGIGVRLRWHTGELPPAGNGGGNGAVPPVFGIRTVDHAPKSATSGALASARPFGSHGAEITVYGDRARFFLEGHPTLRGAAPGYILAHELAHVMQGVARHSESGILKAGWSGDDYKEMTYHKLTLTHSDVLLIHQGLGLQAANAPD